MSETVRRKGKLIQMTLEEIEKEIPFEVFDVMRTESIQNIKENFFRDYIDTKDLHNNYHCRKGVVYKIELEECDWDEYLFEHSKNENGTIDFDFIYYNGGCSLGELLDQALGEQEQNDAKANGEPASSYGVDSHFECDRIDQLIETFGKKSLKSVDKNYNLNRALWRLLNKHKEELPQADDYFHKAFRQIDVIDETTDGVIWHLLCESQLFWECWKEIFDEAQ